MEAVRIRSTVDQDGEVHLSGLPCKRGQEVELILIFEEEADRPTNRLTARQLLHSGLIGLWRDRDEIQDSSAFARSLREQAQQRARG